jgi:hypothetical protein
MCQVASTTVQKECNGQFCHHKMARAYRKPLLEQHDFCHHKMAQDEKEMRSKTEQTVNPHGKWLGFHHTCCHHEAGSHSIQVGLCAKRMQPVEQPVSISQARKTCFGQANFIFVCLLRYEV